MTFDTYTYMLLYYNEYLYSSITYYCCSLLRIQRYQQLATYQSTAAAVYTFVLGGSGSIDYTSTPVHRINFPPSTCKHPNVPKLKRKKNCAAAAVGVFRPAAAAAVAAYTTL